MTAPQKADKPIAFFTMIELLTVISIIAILASMLFPAFKNAKKRAKYTRWLAYSNNLKADPDLLTQYTFENTAYIKYKDTRNDTLPNMALGLSFDHYSARKLDGEVIGCAKTNHGRWPTKGAMFFSGSDNSYVRIADGNWLNPATNSFSVYLWFKFSSNKKACIISKGNSRNKLPGWRIYKDAKNRFRARIQNSLSGKTTNKKTRYQTNQWHMLALVIDRGKNEVNTYVDTELVISTILKTAKVPKNPKKPVPVTSIEALEDFSVLGRSTRKGWAYKGYIDEVEIFKRALSQKELRQAYEMGRP